MTNWIIYKDAQYICEQIDFKYLTGATIIVSGASGLMGTYFIASLRWLLEQGINIKVYPLIFSEPPPHISDLVKHSGFEMIKTNLADFKCYQKLPEADVIIHSAGYAQPTLFMADPITTLQINTSASIALLNKLRKNGRFLFLSSGEVYSGLKNSPFTETSIGTSNPFHPRASYIEGKRCGEAICNAFRSRDVYAKSTRLGHVYGPGTRKHDQRALNSFIERALCKKKIELLDSGAILRTYCYVSDAVELLWKILLYGKEPIYNVGGRSSVTIAGLAKIIGKIVNVPVIFPKIQEGILGAPHNIRLDMTKVEKEFGKTKYINLENGLRRTVDWQRELYEKC
jgi:nucleoside-diphosphate-sugar epimerase